MATFNLSLFSRDSRRLRAHATAIEALAQPASGRELRRALTQAKDCFDFGLNLIELYNATIDRLIAERDEAQALIDEARAYELPRPGAEVTPPSTVRSRTLNAAMGMREVNRNYSRTNPPGPITP